MTALLASVLVLAAMLTMLTVLAACGAWSAFLAVLADLWNGLKYGLRAMAGLDQKHLATCLPPPARTPRDPREGMDPDDPVNAALLEVCPVCGMDDPERFELGVAAATWNCWPAHEACVAWLGDEVPQPDRRPASWSVSPAGGMRVFVTAARPGGRHSALAVLKAADTVHARTDLIYWRPPAADDLMLVTGEPALPAMAPAVPPGAEVVAWIGIPARCTQVTPAMIRCALPSELPGLR